MQPVVIDKQEPLPALNALQVIQNAIERGISGAELESFVRTVERLEDRRAAQRFAEAVTTFQSECPQVEKCKKGDKAMYAPYEAIMAVAGPIMVRHGIAVTFSTEDTERGIKATCRVRVGSHSETTTVTVPIPASPTTGSGKAVVNDTQLMGQAISYAKRYALAAALNIVTRDEDKDADCRLDTLLSDEVTELAGLIEAKGVDLARFLAWASTAAGYECKALADMPRRIFPEADNYLKSRKVTK